MKKWLPGLLLIGVVVVVFLIFRGGAPKSTSPNQSANVEGALGTNRADRFSSLLNTGNFAFTNNAVALSAAEAEEKRKDFMRWQIATAPEPDMPEMTNVPPSVVMENMRSVFQQYGARFGGNPVGTNPEITALLNGGNPKQAVFIRSDDGLRINNKGELVDNWGTPFFFHQLSAREMEVHSAGPDRVMWTADDLVIK